MFSFVQICSWWIPFAHTLSNMCQNDIARQAQPLQFILHIAGLKGRRSSVSSIKHSCELSNSSKSNKDSPRVVGLI